MSSPLTDPLLNVCGLMGCRGHLQLKSWSWFCSPGRSSQKRCLTAVEDNLGEGQPCSHTAYRKFEAEGKLRNLGRIYIWRGADKHSHSLKWNQDLWNLKQKIFQRTIKASVDSLMCYQQFKNERQLSYDESYEKYWYFETTARCNPVGPPAVLQGHTHDKISLFYFIFSITSLVIWTLGWCMQLVSNITFLLKMVHCLLPAI